MEKIINKHNIRNFAYVNDKALTRPVKGVVLSFFGLGCGDMYDTDTVEGEYYGEKGILYAIPYTDPWAWMNKQAVDYTDEITDVLFNMYELPENTPVVASGGSMGGLSALVYCVYAKRTPRACVVNCPVCDAVYHYTERPDLPRTMYGALWHNACTLDDALRSISPVHLIDKMPDIPYVVFHCDGDRAVNITKHSAAFAKKMREANRDISLFVVPERDHCNLPYAMKKRYAECIVNSIEKTR